MARLRGACVDQDSWSSWSSEHSICHADQYLTVPAGTERPLQWSCSPREPTRRRGPGCPLKPLLATTGMFSASTCLCSIPGDYASRRIDAFVQVDVRRTWSQADCASSTMVFPPAIFAGTTRAAFRESLQTPGALFLCPAALRSRRLPVDAPASGPRTRRPWIQGP